MLKTNRARTVGFLIQPQSDPPRAAAYWKINTEGLPFILPATGGITTNIQVGDPAFEWEGDQPEPGISCVVDTNNPDGLPNSALQTYACLGNLARIGSFNASDTEALFIGTHDNVEHLVTDLPHDVNERMTYNDKIFILDRGQGLTLPDDQE